MSGLLPKVLSPAPASSAIGEWMKVNAESIYGTTASPLGEVPWGRCTAKPGRLYLHVFDWPANTKLQVTGLKNKVKKAYLQADKKHARLLVTREDKDKIIVTVPAEAPDPVNSVIVLEIQNN